MRILTPREAWRRGGNMSKTTDWRLRQSDPTYPERVQVSPGRTGYVEEEWEAWLAARPRVDLRNRSLEDGDAQAETRPAGARTPNSVRRRKPRRLAQASQPVPKPELPEPGPAPVRRRRRGAA
jgi:predicted DNA-binding transcriptional regulator AlpA